MSDQEVPETILNAVINMLAPYRSVDKEDLQLWLSPKELLSRFQVAEMLCVSLPTVDRMVKDGTLKGLRIRRRVLIYKDSVKEVMA